MYKSWTYHLLGFILMSIHLDITNSYHNGDHELLPHLTDSSADYALRSYDWGANTFLVDAKHLVDTLVNVADTRVERTSKLYRVQ